MHVFHLVDIPRYGLKDITTIHKANDITDPNNYRGITVTSAIGKVFNSILNTKLHN